ncbi:MAG: hypothetical protein HQK92_13685 [Nitrospirae bacterium]|nr:hypothetical protein [Nitrospirota bacterium]
MPNSVTDVNILRDYLQGVMVRAGHHAQDVNEIALAIAGAIIWRKDDKPLEVMVQQGEMKNVLWVKINNQRYALSYNHSTTEIELRKGTTQGSVIGTFKNNTPLSDVARIFGGL